MNESDGAQCKPKSPGRWCRFGVVRVDLPGEMHVRYPPPAAARLWDNRREVEARLFFGTPRRGQSFPRPA
jgi:hypothetical protein